MQLTYERVVESIRAAAGRGELPLAAAEETIDVISTCLYQGRQACDADAVAGVLRGEAGVDDATVDRLVREAYTCDDTEKPPARRHSADSAGLVPILGWDRYEITRLLGRGGMGDVYLARDPRLDRHVAIKILHRNDAEVVRRFTREAQLQARIDHDNICPVFEVGEVRGSPFIVMQYLSGGSLKELSVAATLSLRDRVRILADVAGALHTAHEAGLIHRDVKPANIMLEQTPSGWRPYVVDFGIARDLAEQDLTIPGQVLGTPAFSAPEQVRGETRSIDRRTDVYSLGATLHWFLSGRAPFAGGYPEIVARVEQDEPEPLRRLDPRVPQDIETIVTRCLEKEPQRRYQTAAELAADLHRFLDGEAIEACPPTLRYRIGKKLRKHRRLVAAAGVVLAVFVVFAALGLRGILRARQQALVAQRLIEQVEEIESLSRVTAMMPEHDRSPERELIHSALGNLQEELTRLGRIGQGPAHYAIGRGYLALEEWPVALHHLQLATRQGYRTPAVSHAIGLAMGKLYERELEQVIHVEDTGLRAAALAEAQERLRAPALDHLRQGGELQVERAAYGEGLILFYEGRLDEALTRARAAYRRAPWLWEARRLEGDILVEKGLEQARSGNYASALKALEGAGESYQTAAEIGRSDAAIYEQDCRRLAATMELQVRSGHDPTGSFSAALQSCRRAIRIDAGRPQAHARIAHLQWRWADYLQDRGGDPEPALAQAVAAADRALDLEPDLAAAHYTRGGALTVSAIRQIGRGQDPRSTLQAAIASLQAAVDHHPGFVQALDDLGYAHERLARYQMGIGVDPRPALARAAAHYSRAISLQPSYPNSHNNLGITLWRRACYERALGLDPLPSLDAAVAAYDTAVSLNPGYAYAHANRGLAMRTRALHLLESNHDPMPWIEQACASLGRALELNPQISWAYPELAAAELVAARWQLRHHSSPRSHLERAGQAAGQAMRLNPHNALAFQTAAEVHRWRAEWQLRQDQTPLREVASGRKLAEAALRLKPDQHSTRLTQAALLLIQASGTPAGSRQDLVREAQEQLDRAVAGNSLLDRDAALLRQRADHLLIAGGR